MLCPICQAKPEPECVLCTARKVAVAAAQVLLSTAMLTHALPHFSGASCHLLGSSHVLLAGRACSHSIILGTSCQRSCFDMSLFEGLVPHAVPNATCAAVPCWLSLADHWEWL